MFELNAKNIKDKYENVKTAADNTVDKMKDIRLCTAFDAGLEVKSQKKQKKLFGIQMSVNKEFSLFNLVLILMGAALSLMLISSVVKAMLPGKNKCCEDDCSSFEE